MFRSLRRSASQLFQFSRVCGLRAESKVLNCGIKVTHNKQYAFGHARMACNNADKQAGSPGAVLQPWNFGCGGKCWRSLQPLFLGEVESANARSAVPQPSDANEVWIKDRGQAVIG